MRRRCHLRISSCQCIYWVAVSSTAWRLQMFQRSVSTPTLADQNATHKAVTGFKTTLTETRLQQASGLLQSVVACFPPRLLCLPQEVVWPWSRVWSNGRTAWRKSMHREVRSRWTVDRVHQQIHCTAEGVPSGRICVQLSLNYMFILLHHTDLLCTLHLVSLLRKNRYTRGEMYIIFINVLV